MKTIQRVFGLLILLALFTNITAILAQDETEITATGSGIVAPLFEALTNASESGVTATINITGNNGGFAALCAGEADVALSNRSMSADEDANCITNEAAYTELLLGHYIIALVGNPETAISTCLSTTQIEAIFAPSAAGQLVNWNELDAENPDQALTVVIPEDISLGYFVFDGFLSGDGLRSDAEVAASDEAIIALVNETPGAIGIVNLEFALNSETAQIIDVSTSTDACSAPDAGNTETGVYPYTQPLFAYVSNDALENEAVKALFEFAVSTAATDTVLTQAFTPISAEASEMNLAALAGEETGRIFSQVEAGYQISPGVAGQVVIAGSAMSYSPLNSITQSFTSEYPSVTIDASYVGNEAGMRSLCNGESDIAVISGEITTEQAENCAANEIETLTLSLGARSVVLLSNSDDQFAVCLSPEQLITIWGTQAAGTVNNWQDVDASFPDVEMTLFGMNEGVAIADIMLTPDEGPVVPVRDDTEHDTDALYRAAAVNNVPGSLTYMSWSDYQRVLQNNQEGIQLVNITDGNECVPPDEASIADGRYPLARPMQLVVNKAALTEPAVQGLLWYVFQPENVSRFTAAAYVGIDTVSATSNQETLQLEFTLAEQAAQEAREAAAEVTPEPDSAESTPEPAGN